MCVYESAQEIPQKIPNESQVVEWRHAQTAVDQSVPTHCKSHTPQVGTGGEACRGPVPPQPLLVLWGHHQLRTRKKAPQVEMENSNQTTQVVHLGGQLIRSFGKQKRVFIYHQ